VTVAFWTILSSRAGIEMGRSFPFSFGDVDSPQRLRAVRVAHEAMVERRDVPPHVLLVLPVRDLIHPRSRLSADLQRLPSTRPA
jgi:hypothetical protein